VSVVVRLPLPGSKIRPRSGYSDEEEIGTVREREAIHQEEKVAELIETSGR